MIRNLLFVVSGKVQGVFYRASAKAIADQLGVKGFVRNLSDGQVFIEAEGEHEALNALHTWCMKGPPRAVVNQVDVTEGEVKGHGEFRVIR